MVATRRMAQKGPEDELAGDQDPELALRKKPVRKATAKTKQKEPKPRTTRGKTAELEPEVQVVEEPAQKLVYEKSGGRTRKQIAEAPPAVEKSCKQTQTKRSTAAGSMRGRKAVTEVEEASVLSEPEDAKPAKSTKTGPMRARTAVVEATEQEAAPPPEQQKPKKVTKGSSVRSKKAAVAIEEAPALPVPESKPTRRTRTTAPKAQPLSPKKITQVSKPATQTTRNASQKPATEVVPAKASLKGNSTTRKRTVSDENAEVPDFGPTTEVEDNDVIMLSSTPLKHKSVRGQGKKQEDALASEASMSSRPTTPGDSTVQSFSQHDVEIEEIDDQNSDLEASASVREDSDASDDELCGPKTPMKRSSPGAEGRYLSSVQRTIRKYEDEQRTQTSARRLALTTSRRGTPQSQKPYFKAVAPTSEVRPMTVARGTDRAFVFKDLRDGAPEVVEDEPTFSDQDELSFVPDDNIIPMDDGDEMSTVPTQASAEAVPIQLQSPPESIAEVAEDDEMPDDEHHQTDEDEGFVVPSHIEADPEETILVHDVESTVTSPVMQPAESFESGDTMLITRSDDIDRDEDMSVVESENEDDDDAGDLHASRNVEATVQESTTILVNFDEHLAVAHQSTREDQTEGIVNVLEGTVYLQDNEDAVAGAEMDFDIEVEFQELQPSRRETINFNDFIDVTALSEPTVTLEPSPVETQNEPTDEIDVELTVEEAALADESHAEVESICDDLFTENEDAATSPPPQQDEPPVLAEPEHEHTVPHYALPTIAFDARRKSLPALSHYTPARTGTRPNTSDGASMPRIVNPFANAWWSRSRAESSATTPVRARPSTAHETRVASNFNTPAKSSSVTTPVATPKERFPRLAPRQDYEEHAKTVAAPVRFQKPLDKSPKRRETFHKAISGRVNPAPVPATPEAPSPAATPSVTPSERYPKLRTRQNYEEHAKTVAAPTRFQTPAKVPLKRPATSQKPESLRKAALKANTPMASRTPIKTPLKAPAMTPSQAPMTPHPAAPLRGVVALVEVFTLEGASASQPFTALLHRLGAKTTKSWNDRVTHVIFKDGSPTTLQRVRLNNKEVEERGTGTRVHCVNSRWIGDCDTEGMRKDESDEAYVVDVAEVPRGGKRRRKSMEPSALMNMGGNIVRDRKSSLSRVSSLGRSPLKFDSPAKNPEIPIVATPEITMADKENSGDEQGSPATPAWIAAPEQLVQQTAPMNRVRKLELKGGNEAKYRRLTFWNGGA